MKRSAPPARPPYYSTLTVDTSLQATEFGTVGEQRKTTTTTTKSQTTTPKLVRQWIFFLALLLGLRRDASSKQYVIRSSNKAVIQSSSSKVPEWQRLENQNGNATSTTARLINETESDEDASIEDPDEPPFRSFSSEQMDLVKGLLPMKFRKRMDFTVNYHKYMNTQHKEMVMEFIEAEEGWQQHGVNDDLKDMLHKLGFTATISRSDLCSGGDETRLVELIEPDAPANPNNVDDTPSPIIPKLIFQKWRTNQLGESMCRNVKRWVDRNPDFTYVLFDDDKAEAFIREYYGENILQAYLCVQVPAARCDIWRLLVIFRFGGFYVDFDSSPKDSAASLNDLLQAEPNRTYLTPSGWGCGQAKRFLAKFKCPHQWALLYAPRHDILREAILQTLFSLADRSAFYTMDVAFYPFLRAFWMQVDLDHLGESYMLQWSDFMNGTIEVFREDVKEEMKSNGGHEWELLPRTKESIWDANCLAQANTTDSSPALVQ